jgi:hypothetical protein
MDNVASSGRLDLRKAMLRALLAIMGFTTLIPDALAQDAAVEIETGLWQLPGVVSILHEPPGPVHWTVDIMPASYRPSYLQTACGILARSGDHGEVRFVDAVMVHAGRRFPSAGLGHIDCSKGEIVHP